MRLPISRWFAILVAAFMVSAFTTSAVAAEDGRQGRLVSVPWLQQRVADVILLDASFAHQYKAGHIAGAVSADNYGGQEPSLAVMEKRLQSWGVSPGRKIVIYDKGGEWSAARLFHDLYYYGVTAEDIFILDGGLAKWQAQGGAVTKDATPLPTVGTFRIAKVREEVRSRLPEFLLASGDKANHALVDALGASYFYGEEKFFTRAGHVPNAIALPSTDFFNADKTFKSPEEIRRMASYFGVHPGQVVHSHCGGGGAAAVPWFALQFVADFPKVKLYWESHREWLRDERELPFWTYAAPQLQRDSAWLDGWNAPMLRAFGVAQLNIVDVRSAEKYGQGHIPFSLNIPVETFRKHLGQPQQIAALLGPAGVSPAHEVVIVSGAGVTPDAALAFLAFEQLGQTKVSILTDAIDEWGARGAKLVTAPTIVGMQKTPMDITVPTATYTAKPRTDVVTNETKSATGPYPKVYISSGAQAASTNPDGKFFHLPQAGLLNSNGTLKPAKDLWKIIDNAKIPRHAELVLYADDIADAAVNYFAFRLMGWPNVKVLAR